jgi:hypothetical protein
MEYFKYFYSVFSYVVIFFIGLRPSCYKKKKFTLNEALAYCCSKCEVS